MTWQPIDTAPKDGTSVLLYGEPDGEINGRWGTKEIVVGCFGAGRWDATITDAYSVSVEATHWMPLPPPPSEVKE